MLIYFTLWISLYWEVASLLFPWHFTNIITSVNLLSYADDIVLLAPTVTALQTLLEVCRAYAVPHDMTKQSQSRYSTRVRLWNEELFFVAQIRYLGHVMTADCRDDNDIKKEFRRQNADGNKLVRKFSFAPMEEKIQLFKPYCYQIYGCALWRHSYQNVIKNLLSVIVTHSSVVLMSLDTPARVWHINVVFSKFAYSLMSREITSTNSIVTAIINSDAYHQSPLMDK